MKLLLVNYEFPPLGAGAATATYHVGKELVLMGHDVVVLTSSHRTLPRFEDVEGMKVHRIPALRKITSQSNMVEMMSFVVSAFFMMPSILRSCRIEKTMVFFSFPCGPLGLWAKILSGVPYLVLLRGGDVPGTEPGLDKIHALLTPIRRLVYGQSRRVVANSPGLKALAEKADPVDVSMVPNGVDTDFYSPSEKNLSNKPFQFLFTGRFSEQKNLFFLFDALAKFKTQSKSDFLLHMAGDGPLKGKLMNHAMELGMNHGIVWHGWCGKTQLRELYRQSDCLINPSLYEGMPNVVLEAMACGLPVIASRVPGNDTLVKDGETGLLFELPDGDGLVRALGRVMGDDPGCRRMGKSARKFVVERHSWTRAARSFFDLFG